MEESKKCGANQKNENVVRGGDGGSDLFGNGFVQMVEVRGEVGGFVQMVVEIGGNCWWLNLEVGGRGKEVTGG